MQNFQKQSKDQQILSEAYRDLLARYGELRIQKQNISKEIKDLEAKLDSLNFFAPITVKIRQELDKDHQTKQELLKVDPRDAV